MNFAAALAAVSVRPNDPESLDELARVALAEGEEAAALAVMHPGADRSGSSRLWQWIGLLHRALDEHEQALEALATAVRLDPADASIAHGYARVTLEAGLDARALFDRAIRLAASADVIVGRVAARFAMGEGEEAAAELAAILDRNPMWTQGHVQWAQLAAMNGKPAHATQTVDRALALHAREPGLWHTAIHILASAERHAEARERAEAAIAATGDANAFALSRAAALSDAGDARLADEAFATLEEPVTVHHAIHRARHQVRLEQWDRLAALASRWMEGESAHHFWPYASIAWRKTGDPRWHWLEGDERLVRVYDLAPSLPPLEDLAELLRGLHRKSGRFLDQSVRGGTQTDGPLFSRIDPQIRALRGAIVKAVNDYRASLPPLDIRHPMLRLGRGGPVRFAGSWSVRLNGAGFHDNHIHPQGWISSAFYVSAPADLDAEQGSLVLGQPQSGLGVDMPAIRRVAPTPGRLVLFPSMMWHGTTPFERGERMTVAFDVAGRP